MVSGWEQIGGPLFDLPHLPLHKDIADAATEVVEISGCVGFRQTSQEEL